MCILKIPSSRVCACACVCLSVLIPVYVGVCMFVCVCASRVVRGPSSSIYVCECVLKDPSYMPNIYSMLQNHFTHLCTSKNLSREYLD